MFLRSREVRGLDPEKTRPDSSQFFTSAEKRASNNSQARRNIVFYVNLRHSSTKIVLSLRDHNASRMIPPGTLRKLS